MNDVFISYEHESKSIADNICSVLERNKIRCWYAPRDVIGDYATSIVQAINNAKIFILILNGSSSNSRHVLNEVEMAYKIEKGLTIIPFKVDNDTLSMAMEYYVKRLHWIDAADRSLDLAIDDLLKKVAVLLNIDLNTGRGSSSEAESGSVRLQNKYFHDDDSKEKARLRTQLRLLRPFDMPIYEKALSGKENITVLDVGSNDGDYIIDRLGDRPEVSKIIGIEYDAPAVENANEKHGTDSIRFYQCDIESPDFATRLEEIMEDSGTESFDFINMSMLLLHLKNPYKVLRILRQYLSDDGVVFIKDIDDGLSVAYPDPDGAFERAKNICNGLETSGYRHSGREIYSMLKKCGMRSIRLEKLGFNTVGMNFKQRQALFDSCFSFIKDDLCVMAERHPDDKNVRDDMKWYLDVYDDMEEQFHSEEFLYNAGFVIYLAEN